MLSIFFHWYRYSLTMGFLKQGLHGDDVDFENTWATIEAAFGEIHTKNASKLSYEELYRYAYRIVLKKKGENLYNKVHEFERNWLAKDVRKTIHKLLSPNLLAEAQSASGTSPNERRVAGEKFLKGLKQAWGDHQVCMSMLADVLMYMVRLHLQIIFLRLTYTPGSCILRRSPPYVHLQCCYGTLPR